jgi:hypothetical protein
MKTILTTFAASCIALTALAETEKKVEVTRNPDGTTTKTVTKVKFDGDTRTKVTTYFDTYKTHRYGVPPEWSASWKVKEIPVAWRTGRIEPGVVIADTQRVHLFAAPPELVKLLPPTDAGVRYYVAGRNVIAVNASYEVVDTIHVPSINLTVEE